MQSSTKVISPISNQRIWISVWIFCVLSSGLFLWFAYNWGERLGLVFGLAFSVFFNFLIFVFGGSKLLHFLNATPLRGQDPWNLNEYTDTIAEKLKMARPDIFVFESHSVHAFVVGLPWKPNAIALSSELLRKFKPHEIEAITTHLLVFLQQNDSFIYGVTTVIVNTFVGAAEKLDLLWPVNFFFDRKQEPFGYLASLVGWSLIKIVRRKNTYYRCDTLTAELLANRHVLAECLWRMQGLSETAPLEVPPCSSHYFVVNPESYKQDLFFRKTHPSMKYRLEKLVGYYPI